jgi:transcriptional regulator with XRE-family HTH domain
MSARAGKPPRACRQSRVVDFGPDQRERELVLLGFGETLRGMRRGEGLSQEVLAMRCFMPRDQIGGFESGKRAPDLPALLVLAQRLGVSIAALTEGLEAPVRKVSTAQVQGMVARERGVKTDRIAVSLALPLWFVSDITVYLQSIRAIVRGADGWHPSVPLSTHHGS